MPPPHIGTSHPDDKTVAVYTTYEMKPAHEHTETSASIHGIESLKAKRHRMAATWIETIFAGQEQAESHAFAVFRNLKFRLHVGGSNLRIFECLSCYIQNSRIGHDGVVFGYNPHRDECLVIAERHSENCIEWFIQAGTLVTRLSQSEAAPFKLGYVVVNLSQSAFVKRHGRI